MQEKTKKKTKTEVMKKDELIVFAKAKALASYVVRVSARAAVKYRYSLVTPLIYRSHEAISLLYEANVLELSDPKRKDLIRQAIGKVELVSYLGLFCAEVGALSKKRGENIALLAAECLKYCFGYMAICKS